MLVRIVSYRVLLCCCVSVSASLCASSLAFGQASAPNREQLFLSDTKGEQRAEAAALRKARSKLATPQQGLDFQAPIIDFDKERNRITGRGGVLVSEGGVQVQADEGSFDMQSREGDVKGNVVMTSPSGVLASSAATLNVPNETGTFSDIQFEVDAGGFQVEADKARKVSEFDFELDETSLTSCNCPDKDKPWEVSAKSCELTKGAYAHTYDSTLYFQGLPVFYSPYLVFPVKDERASGLLPPRWGMSNRDGFMLNQPILGIIDDSTDVTFTPFVATNSRYGAELQGQKVFSKTSNVRGGLLYSNESLRGDDLRGLNTNGVFDDTIDQQRLGGYYRQKWQSDRRNKVPVSFIADGHYTSDNLFLREITEPNIGDQQAQFLVSTAVLRASAFEKVYGEVRSEYNQMLLTDQDLQFQRLPEAALSTSHSFRPVGFNPYGLKVVTDANAVATNFVRDNGYEGWRVDMRPKVTVPFHISSYVRGGFSAELRQTEYSLSDTAMPVNSTPIPTPSSTPSADATGVPAPDATSTPAPLPPDLESSNSRTLPILSYGMGSAVERVYDVDRDGLFARMVTLGARNERKELTRLKHTIEPSMTYAYVPDIDQTDLPQFDQNDRYRQRSLVGYGVTSRLYGRFVEPYERSRDVEELTPSSETLPTFDLSSSVLDFGRSLMLMPGGSYDQRTGSIRELVTMSLKQNYDFVEAQKNLDPQRDAFSDWNIGLSLAPSPYFATGVQSNVSNDGSFSSYQLSFGVRDDRDDALRARYSFIDNALEQLEGNAEVKLHEQFRLGYYARYDVTGSEMLENRGLLRFVNACKCWSVDLGLSQRVNPDRQQIMLSFSLGGIGNLAQGAGLAPQGGNNF
jgi:LPS-assembly protein